MSNADGSPVITGPQLPHAEFFAGIRANVHIGSVKLCLRLTRKHGLMLHTANPGDHFRHEGSPVVAGDYGELGRERKHMGRIVNPRSAVNPERRHSVKIALGGSNERPRTSAPSRVASVLHGGIGTGRKPLESLGNVLHRLATRRDTKKPPGGRPKCLISCRKVWLRGLATTDTDTRWRSLYEGGWRTTERRVRVVSHRVV